MYFSDMTYAVDFTRSAKKEFAAIPSVEQASVARELAQLALNPRPVGSKKLVGGKRTLHRVRAANFRIIYSVNDATRSVTIEKIGHRGTVCRGM